MLSRALDSEAGRLVIPPSWAMTAEAPVGSAADLPALLRFTLGELATFHSPQRNSYPTNMEVHKALSKRKVVFLQSFVHFHVWWECIFYVRCTCWPDHSP